MKVKRRSKLFSQVLLSLWHFMHQCTFTPLFHGTFLPNQLDNMARLLDFPIYGAQKKKKKLFAPKQVQNFPKMIKSRTFLGPMKRSNMNFVAQLFWAHVRLLSYRLATFEIWRWTGKSQIKIEPLNTSVSNLRLICKTLTIIQWCKKELAQVDRKIFFRLFQGGKFLFWALYICN